MPYDTSLTYPFPYKTQDGLIDDDPTFNNVITDNLTASTITTNNLTSNNITTGDISTDALIITQTGQPKLTIDTDIELTRIRTLDDAFGLDIEVQGSGKSIKFKTKEIERMRIEDTAVSTSNQFVSTLASGTAPFAITSTTLVSNLNVSQLLGATWVSPGTIGSTTPNTGAFTTLACTTLTVSSGTVVSNLNASQLLSATWAAPLSIGSTTPNTGTFTNLFSSTLNGTTTVTAANDGIVMGPSTSDTTYIDRNRSGGGWSFGFNSAAPTTQFTRFNIFNNATHQESLFQIDSKGTVSGLNVATMRCPLVVINNNLPQAAFYPIGVGGPASIQVQTSATSIIGHLELCACLINANFGPSSLAGDVIVRNVNAANRVLIQCGGGAATVFVSSTGMTVTNLFSATLNGTTNVTAANDGIVTGPSTSDITYIDRNRTGGSWAFGWNSAAPTTQFTRLNIYNNSTHRESLFEITSRGTSSGINIASIKCPLLVVTNNLPQAAFYPIVAGGPASIQIQTNVTAPVGQFQLCACQINGNFGPSSLAGDVIVQNTNAANRVLIQCGGGNATVFVTSTTMTTSNFFSATLNGTTTVTAANDGIVIGPSATDNAYLDRNRAGGGFTFGWNSAGLTTQFSRFNIVNNLTHRESLFEVLSKGTSSGANQVFLKCPTVITHTASPQAAIYHSTTGPTSLTIQTSATTPTAALELCATAAPGLFSTSAIAGDTIIRNTSGGRVLIQSGIAGANVVISPTVFTYNGAAVATFSQGTWTPSITYITGGEPVPFSGYTNVVGKYTKIGATVTVMFNIQGNSPGSSTQTQSVITINGLPFASTTGAPSQYQLINSFFGGSNPGFFTNNFGLVRTTPLLQLNPNTSYFDILREDDTSNFAVLIIGGGFVDSYFRFSGHMTYICNEI